MSISKFKIIYGLKILDGAKKITTFQRKTEAKISVKKCHLYDSGVEKLAMGPALGSIGLTVLGSPLGTVTRLAVISPSLGSAPPSSPEQWALE